VDIEERVRYNPKLTRRSFGAVVALIDQITMISVLLTGAALIRERERGTAEHLLICTCFGGSGVMSNDPLVRGII
jgi:ABC-2 type transport system permease protein